MTGRGNYDNGFEGIALEFQRDGNDIAIRQAEALEGILAALNNIGLIAQRVEKIIDAIPRERI